MNKNIAIIGNWGLGEITWRGFDEYDVISPIEEHFVNCTITNFSKPQTSNLETVNQLKNTDLTVFDHVIWIQTDPLFELHPYDTLFDGSIKTISDLLQKKSELLNKSYLDLNLLNKEILCLGGPDPLDLGLISNYSNLIPAISNIASFLVPEYTYTGMSFTDWHKIDMSGFIPNFKIGFGPNNHPFSDEEWQQLSEMRLEYRSLWTSNSADYISAEGRQPSRLGFKKIVDYLLENYIFPPVV